MELIFNLDTLLKNKLTISEYLYLKSFYEDNFDKDLFKIIDRVDEDSLQLKGFIKILENEIVLRTKAIELFEGTDLYYKFLSTFPIKSPSGRYLSPLRSKTIKGKEVEKKWRSLFKNKPFMQEKALRVLEAELEWRKKTGSMEYIHNILTWLNQGDYENFEYLLEEHETPTDNRDLM